MDIKALDLCGGLEISALMGFAGSVGLKAQWISPFASQPIPTNY